MRWSEGLASATEQHVALRITSNVLSSPCRATAAAGRTSGIACPEPTHNLLRAGTTRNPGRFFADKGRKA